VAVSPSCIQPLAEAPLAAIDAVMELNQQHVAELSEMDELQLARLVAVSFRAIVACDGDAFLLAFEQDAAYDSSNFHWFKSRYRRFVYVDRLAVAPAARGKGLAKQLYGDLFAAAAAAGHSLITCEVNVEPLNAPSDALHAALGFEEVGRARLQSGKLVRYLCRSLA